MCQAVSWPNWIHYSLFEDIWDAKDKIFAICTKVLWKCSRFLLQYTKSYVIEHTILSVKCQLGGNSKFHFFTKKCFMHFNFLKGKDWMETWLLVRFQCWTDSVSLSPIVCPSTLTSDSFVSSVCFSLLSVKNCLTSSQKLRRHKVCTNTHKHTVILL